ncbi:MAG TPA: AraC family transcriptional regulator [Gemmatimonadales bacterium]
MDTTRRLKFLARAASVAQNARRVLFESLGISVVDFQCHAHVAADGAEEPNPTHSIVLVRRGVFRRTQQRETVLADPNHVLLFNAAEPYRYAHPLPGGDACTILTVETDRALELVCRHAPVDAEYPERPFRRGHGLSSPRTVWLHWEFLNLIARGAGRLALEDALAELANEAVACVYGAPVPSRRASPSTQRRRRDLVETVKLMISERLERPPSLTELADVLDCSPYHLSHTFHGTAGLSLRRYLRRLRARVAAERLAAGASRLTPLALDLGYADHSHFTNSFRREWGVSPSTFRSRLGHVTRG